MPKRPTKRVYFNRSYQKYMRGDLATLEANFADMLVRRGFAVLRPLESEDTFGADGKADKDSEADFETPPPALPAEIGEPETLDNLREKAKDAGIRGYHLMKEETLLERLASADEEE